MNDNSSTNGPQSRMPSDEQMDALLHNFFRLEVPVQLNQSPAVVGSTGAVVEGLAQPQRRSVRFVAVAVSVAAMAMAMLVIISVDNSQPSSGKVDQPMLVSPEGGHKSLSKAVGPDGVTLDETEGVGHGIEGDRRGADVLSELEVGDDKGGPKGALAITTRSAAT